jgi:hypothetical protein
LFLVVCGGFGSSIAIAIDRGEWWFYKEGHAERKFSQQANGKWSSIFGQSGPGQLEKRDIGVAGIGFEGEYRVSGGKGQGQPEVDKAIIGYFGLPKIGDFHCFRFYTAPQRGTCGRDDHG